MIRVSRFSHIFDMGDDSIALYHSLRMKPVYIKKTEYQDIATFLKNSNVEDLSDFPPSLAKIATELRECKILTKNEDSDNNAIQFFRSKIPEPSIRGCYFILSEQCNLACKYCFAEEGEYHGRRELMTPEVGRRALDFLVENSGNRRNLEVDFFGGEPLMNWDVVKRLVDIPEIVECHFTTGPYSMFLKMYARDNSHLLDILNDIIHGIEGVDSTETLISLNQSIGKEIPITREEKD